MLPLLVARQHSFTPKLLTVFCILRLFQKPQRFLAVEFFVTESNCFQRSLALCGLAHFSVVHKSSRFILRETPLQWNHSLDCNRLCKIVPFCILYVVNYYVYLYLPRLITASHPKAPCFFIIIISF